MHQNIRRSLLVAAAASGIWALGTSGANAAEPHVSAGTVTGAAEQAAEGDVTDAVEGAAETVRKTADGVTGGLPSHGIPENGLPSNTLPTAHVSEAVRDTVGAVTDRVEGTLPAAGAGTVADAAGPAGRTAEVTDRVETVWNEVRKGVRPATAPLPAPVAGDLANLTGLPLPLPPRTLPASVPATAAGLPAGTARADIRPEPLTGVLKGDHARRAVGAVHATASAADPVLDTALPADGRSFVVHVRPAAGRVAADAAGTVDDAAATTAPFAGSTAVRTHSLAHHLTAGVCGYGHGVAADAAPYASALNTGLHRGAETAVAGTASAVRIHVVPGARDLTDAANVPGLSVPRLPADVPAVPAVPPVPAV